MAITRLQLMTPPGGPGVIGAVKAGGANTSISGTGAVSFSGGGGTSVTKLISGNSTVSLNPPSGIGNVVVNLTYSGGTGGDDDFPSGTLMPFYQASAPTGWVGSGQDNKTLRIIPNSGGGSGGSRGFTDVQTNYTITGTASAGVTVTGTSSQFVGVPTGATLFTANADAIGIPEGSMPTHNHSLSMVSAPGIWGYVADVGPSDYSQFNKVSTDVGQNQSHSHSSNSNAATLSNGGGLNHDHTFSFGGTASDGNVNAGTVNFSVKYCNLILCRKN